MSELSTEYCECAVVEHYTSSVESVELITTRDSAESESVLSCLYDEIF